MRIPGGRVWLVGLSLLIAGATSAQPLQSRIEKLIHNADLGEATLAVYVAETTDGLPLVEIDADAPMIPASNMKLVTTAAAATLLDEDFAFRTQLRQRGDDLIVVGSGDPAFGDEALLEAMGLNVEHLLNRWVRAVQRRGVRRVERLLVDDRIFDDQHVHPNWPADQLDAWYCAPVAGLNFNDNCVEIYAAPTVTGRAPRIKTRPLSAPVVITNRASTGNRNALRAGRERGANRITLRGTVHHRYPTRVFITVHDPPMFFARTLADRLRAAGIAVGMVGRAEAEQAVGGPSLLAEVRTPLAEVIRRCNRDSQNLFAEALIKRLGHEVTGGPGSWDSGAAAIRMFLANTIGPSAATLVVDDGSGLSRENRLTARQLGLLLHFMHETPDVADRFLDSLAVGGENGTLERRFEDLAARVRGKSGYIRHTITLSGYLSFGPRTYVFSILLNDYRKPVFRGKRLIDRIVAEMDAELAAAEPTSLGSD